MTITRIAAGAIAALLSVAAQAEGVNSVRLGVDYITNHSRATPVTSNGPAFLTPQPAGAKAGNATTLVLGYSRKIDANWDFEVVVGIPPEVDAKGTGTLQSFGTIAKIKEAGPNAFVVYNFGADGDKFRPFAAVGVNYTHFFNPKTTDSGNLALGGPTKVELTDSFGPSAKVGATYTLNEHWSIVGAIAALKVKSDMTTTTGSIERKSTIDFRPIVYTLGTSYRF